MPADAEQSDVEQYVYELPHQLVAQAPLPNRVDARLMVVNRESGTIEHRYVRDLPELLRAGDRLVLNNTRVVRASLMGYRSLTGGRWQGLFISFDDDGRWRILCKTRGKITPGETVTLRDSEGRENIQLRLVEKGEGGIWLAQPESEVESLDLLEQVGHVPLPHYIRGGRMVESDLVNYQTVYAEVPGAVAAPTAGLHFTNDLLNDLTERGVRRVPVTLHVGLDTFRPLSSTSLAEHKMHTEWSDLSHESAQQLNQCRSENSRIVAVGTTSVRVLETVACDGCFEAWRGSTDLFIRPPYDFRAVDVLLTNFHLPRTTLLVLVRTFGGDELIRHAYDEAIQEEYRFYSYGDAMLIV